MDTPAGFELFQKELASLVESFRKRRPHLKGEGYDEMQLRTDFLNPFWKALGWDVENRQRSSQSLREVEVETRVHIGGTKKRVDYAFRIGGVPKFVCEAKKATDELSRKYAYQAQRYAYNLSLFVSVLMNFERLQVFIVGGKPGERDPFPVFKQWDFLHYEEAARELWDLFSKERVAGHSLEELVNSLRKKPIPGKAREGWLLVPERVRTVDEEFLEYIEKQRERLARLLTEANTRKKWSDASLNECIQRIIDRILFVRICEDRDIDTGRSLVAILDEWEEIKVGRPAFYPRLVAHFNSLDSRFNGTLFHQGHESETLGVPDEFLVGIIRELSSEDSPYLFSTLPVEILGSVYEQFIGKVVRLTRHGTVKVEPKPEVRKAGGVYYTPRFVVDYIVEQTVGTLISSQSPDEIAKLRFVDPACGSGSFLLRVFERICEEHLNWLEAHPSHQRKENCYRDDAGTLRLTTHLKRQIMLNNVFGVDIDFRAVEVTMLSLYLKVLEGETRTTLGQNHNLFPAETFLPDLTSNIKCGNSLIAPDFYTGEQLSMLGQAAVVQKVNAFDWKAEFKFSDGGFFDAAVGNPPYVVLQDELRDDAQLAYFREKYQVASYKVDTYHLFIERAIRLCKPGARCSMITPANFLTNNFLAGLRRFILDGTRIDHILVIDGGVFQGVSVDNAIFVLNVGAETKSSWPLIHVSPENVEFRKVSEIAVRVPDDDKSAMFTGAAKSSALWDKVLKQSIRLAQIADVNFGKQLRDRKQFPKDVIDVKNRKKIPRAHKRCYTGKDVERYHLAWGELACLDNTIAQKGGCWDESKQNARNKIVTRQIGEFPIFALDTRGYQCLNTMFMINVHAPYDRHFVLGVLNSALVKAFWMDKFSDQRRTFPKIKGTYLEQLPIFSKDNPEKAEQRRIQEISELAKALVKLNRQVRATRSEQHKRAFQRQIEASEQRIDEAVYELYGLEPKEIDKIQSMARPLNDQSGTLAVHIKVKKIPEPGRKSQKGVPRAKPVNETRTLF